MTMAKLAVLIYNGLGANETGCHQLLSALRSCLDLNKYSVGFITPEEIIKGTKMEGAPLIAFGAGYTSGFATALGDEGMRNLRDHIFKGHSYLGFGAGGYFGCDYIEFDKGGPLEKLTERELRFYSGVCSGPAYAGFQYGTYKGVHAVPIDFTSDYLSATFHAMIDGGGMFCSSSQPKPGSQVLEVIDVAKFVELPGSPSAIVKTQLHGDGLAILSGVHLEYDMPSLIDSEPELEYLRKSFINSRSSQLSAFKALIQMLHLSVD